MEPESLVYFHPMPETYKMTAATKHRWESVSLPGKVLPAEAAGGFFVPVDCPVPLFYYKKKPWKQENLLNAMEIVVGAVPGMADAFLHPKIMTLISQEKRERWEPRRETQQRLSAALLAGCAADCLFRKGRVTVLLGRHEDTDWQMEMTRRLLEPYLPRINSLIFYYEEVEGTDIWEETAEELETYGYEYGLVPGMMPYLDSGEGLCCGRERCGGVILDYADAPRYPRVEREGQTVYADLTSSPEKEQGCIRKSGRILYSSPLKYLDTIVKNEYYRKMYAMAMSSAQT